MSSDLSIAGDDAEATIVTADPGGVIDGQVRQAAIRFRRALWLAGLGVLCFAAALLVDGIAGGRLSPLTRAAAKIVAVLAGVFSLAMALRETARQHRELTNAIRESGESARELALQSTAMREAEESARNAGAAKGQLFASIAHELRTPLQSIIGILQAAIDTEISAEGTHQLEMARRSAQTLLATIEDVLDLTSLDARQLTLEPVYFSIRQLLAETLKPLGITAAEKGLTLAFAVAAEVPDRLWGDPLRLRQILVNLTGNALKFTSSGEVVVRVWCDAMSAAGVSVVFEVSDTGVGIDPSLRNLLLGPFVAAHSVVRRHTGSGLGLAIVSRLLEAMGGTIGIDSELGKGSTFRVAVPLPCEPIGAEAPPEWEQQLAGVRVLLIEPNTTTREIFAAILRAHGMVAEAYATLDSALQPAIRAAYACLVADAGVLATTPWIPPVPVVRIVSPVTPPAGDGFVVTRPAGSRELIEAVGAALGIAEPAILYTLERRPEAVRPLRVLVVDDNTVTQELIADAARRLGSIVTVTATSEAPGLLEGKIFDVALVDVETPELDAANLARRFRAVDRAGRTPMIAVTGNVDTAARDCCAAAGFEGVLRKPATQAAIGAIIRDVTGSRIPSHEPLEPSGSILDAVGGNVRLLRRVRDAFTTQIPRLLDTMRAAIETRDAGALGQAARTLRGAVSNFDVLAPIAAALQIEHAGTAGDFARASELLPEIETAIYELQERIDGALS